MGNPAAGKSVVSDELYTQMQDNSFTDLSRHGLSSAIFWTSQGLNVLGQAIAPGFTGIPGCTQPPAPGTECQKPKPPRNAVYIFESKPNLQGFNPPMNVSQYLQCFNIKPPSRVPGGSTYYCDRSGSLPQQIEDTTKLRGKICDTTNLGTDCKMIN